MMLFLYFVVYLSYCGIGCHYSSGHQGTPQVAMAVNLVWACGTPTVKQ